MYKLHSDKYFKMLHTFNVKYIKMLLTDEYCTLLHYFYIIFVHKMLQFIYSDYDF